MIHNRICYLTSIQTIIKDVDYNRALRPDNQKEQKKERKL